MHIFLSASKIGKHVKKYPKRHNGCRDLRILKIVCLPLTYLLQAKTPKLNLSYFSKMVWYKTQNLRRFWFDALAKFSSYIIRSGNYLFKRKLLIIRRFWPRKLFKGGNYSRKYRYASSRVYILRTIIYHLFTISIGIVRFVIIFCIYSSVECQLCFGKYDSSEINKLVSIFLVFGKKLSIKRGIPRSNAKYLGIQRVS